VNEVERRRISLGIRGEKERGRVFYGKLGIGAWCQVRVLEARTFAPSLGCFTLDPPELTKIQLD
jgi:hypothetical protein